MDHPHPLTKICAHPRLFTSYTNKQKHLAHARMMRVFMRQTWDEFLYTDRF